MEDLRPIYEIAAEIKAVWGTKVNYAAKPYLEAMLDLTDRNSKYAYDDAIDIVLRFLSNATSFRGETARNLKSELKAHIS